MKSEKQLIVFTRYPEPGSAKTRLIPTLGSQGAALLQRRMTEDIVWKARETAAVTGAALTVSYQGGSARQMQDWLGPGIAYTAQRQGSLGERMADAFRKAFDLNARTAVIVGSDCPSLDPEYLAAAFEALREHDVVIGPASDGGYVLLGLRAQVLGISAACLFEGIPWGTETVLRRTREALKRTSLRTVVLDERWDVDSPEDLQRLQTHWGGAPPTKPEPPIAVIIPTKNEEDQLETTLQSVATAANVGVLVSAGKSTDATVEIAARYGADILESGHGRARQLNDGARQSDAPLLLFLHADTVLPLGYDSRIRRAARQVAPAALIGAFELRIDGHDHGLRLIEKMTNWHARRRALPCGDQALFMSRTFFEDIGGFPDMPIMEDYEFMRRARRRSTPVVLPAPVTTSARRWQRLGPWPTVALNQVIVAAYRLGVAPERLAAWYGI